MDNKIDFSNNPLLLEAKNIFESNATSLRHFDKYLQLLIKHNEIDLAETLIATSILLKEKSVDAGMVHAHLLYKLKKYNDADLMFDELVNQYPENVKLRIIYAQTLKKRRKTFKAYGIVSPIKIEQLDAKQLLIYQDIVTLYTAVETREGRPLLESDDFCILAMKHAILHFREKTQSKLMLNAPELEVPTLGKVSLITGSLGPGGAERQLCLTAQNINTNKKQGISIAGVLVDKEVDVLINSYESEGEKNFFLPFLKENKISLFQIKQMASTPIEQLGIDSPLLINLLNENPSPVRYGLNRLVTYFHNAGTEVAFIWQDSAILFAAVAALIAGVPKIVLNFRGYPPNLRPHLFKQEYLTLYQSLAQIPAVTFVTNTQATAKAYREWLQIPASKFRVIYNGINPATVLNHGPFEADLWSTFEKQTIEATETLGGVFRFENDKRPILVIRFFHRYLKKHPLARCILVGEGRLKQQCIELAQELGMIDKILFVGLSKNVPYWLDKMDAMVLMSLYEGLPNVLIEAQFMGVPVVSTPAGGAAECFIEGETGSILSHSNEPDLYEACEKVHNLITNFKNNPQLKNKAIDYASEKFSITGMLENTILALTQKSLESQVCEDLI